MPHFAAATASSAGDWFVTKIVATTTFLFIFSLRLRHRFLSPHCGLAAHGIQTVRINCIGLLCLHHLFYKGAAGSLGLQVCITPDAASPVATTPGAVFTGAGPRGSPTPYKYNPSLINRDIQFYSYSSPLT
jgi:hypothetical protein